LSICIWGLKIARGGKRPGAGRPKGSKTIRRSDVINARKEDWDKWEKNTKALERVRKMLLEIVEDTTASARDRIAAGNIIEQRGLGKATEEREQLPSPTLVIIRPGEQPKLDTSTIEGEIVREELELLNGG